MSFDEQPDGDPHGECAAEIHKLRDLLRDEFNRGHRFDSPWDCADAYRIRSNDLETIS